MDTDPLHRTLSVLIATTVKAEPLRCWRKAILAILTFPELFASGAYVEGWIVIPRKRRIDLVEHGWCTSPEGGIIDPSLVLSESRDQVVIYVPGYELSGSKVRSSISGKTIPLVCNSQYGRDGMGHQGYKQSYEKAWQCAHDLARDLHLSQSAINVSTRDTKQGLTIIVQN